MEHKNVGHSQYTIRYIPYRLQYCVHVQYPAWAVVYQYGNSGFLPAVTRDVIKIPLAKAPLISPACLPFTNTFASVDTVKI
jgi:hypothetical protein